MPKGPIQPSADEPPSKPTAAMRAPDWRHDGKGPSVAEPPYCPQNGDHLSPVSADRGAGAGRARSFGDCRQLQERAGPTPVRSAHDDGAASAWLRERHLLVAADRQGGLRAGGFHDDRGRRPAGLPHRLGVPPTASGGAGGAVRAGVAALREGGIGEARARGARRHQDQGQRVQAQGDEL